ncbi:MAG: 7-cyano-7-deazaguanine synthase, partial [Patescibacteria group bacterium]|nr:7-cyano-7-deazaguanine synthase [Patescibacteria group bacterium]
MMNCYKKYKKSKNPNDKMRKNKNNKRVIVGLSGGIDSSVALILLKKQGYQPIGVSLKFSTWPNQENLSRKNLCRSQDPFHLVRKLCQNLKVPYHLIDCQKEFEKIVIKYFIKEWKNGRTPNPCIICNQKLKFPKLFELAKRFQAGCVATGHYARLRRGPSISNYQVSNKSHGSNIQLLKATDENKDQSYFLYTLKQNQLAKLIFPLGNITKDKVRKIAEKEKICYLKRESQDFCFLVNQSLFDFLKIKIGQRPG